jgi:hypothetical protein
MNQDEAYARAFLESEGYTEITYEPDGNVPPDFLVDGRIGVEVRRLNQSVPVGGIPRGLESDEIAIGKAVRQVLDDLGPAPAGGEPYYIKYAFQRPLAPFKQIKRELRAALEAIRAGTAPPSEQYLACGLRVSVFLGSHRATNQFRPAIVVDEDSGGWVLDLLKQNIELYAAEKDQKITPYRSKYPQWWLILVDHIGYGLDDYDRSRFQSVVMVKHSWDRVVLIDPTDPTRGLEVQPAA